MTESNSQLATQTPSKAIVANIALLLVSLFFMFLVGEFVVRFNAKAWPFETEIIYPPHLNSSDKHLRWLLPPKRGKGTLAFGTREIGDKQEGHVRILYLGDSLVWEGDTSSGKLYTEVIENNLNRKLESEGRRFEVVNAGIPGYTTYQESEFLKAHGLAMQPDLVVLGFVLNDVYYRYLHKPTANKLLDHEPSVRLHRFNTESFPGVLLARSYLAHLSLYGFQRAMKRIGNKPEFPFDDRLDFYLAWKEYGWNETRELIDGMQQLLREKDSSFLVVVYPIEEQFDERLLDIDKHYVLYPQTRIATICRDLGIPCLDLTECLRKAGGAGVFRDYLHLNTTGNDVVAIEVTQFLIENKSIWLR